MRAQPEWLTSAILWVFVWRTRPIHMYFLPPSVQRHLTNSALLINIISLKVTAVTSRLRSDHRRPRHRFGIAEPRPARRIESSSKP
ncbi:hypothetical protein BDW71DRAFT_179884 [Aspergillus fruticulosus]